MVLPLSLSSSDTASTWGNCQTWKHISIHTAFHSPAMSDIFTLKIPRLHSFWLRRGFDSSLERSRIWQWFLFDPWYVPRLSVLCLMWPMSRKIKSAKYLAINKRVPHVTSAALASLEKVWLPKRKQCRQVCVLLCARLEDSSFNKTFHHPLQKSPLPDKCVILQQNVWGTCPTARADENGHSELRSVIPWKSNTPSGIIWTGLNVWKHGADWLLMEVADGCKYFDNLIVYCLNKRYLSGLLRFIVPHSLNLHQVLDSVHNGVFVFIFMQCALLSILGVRLPCCLVSVSRFFPCFAAWIVLRENGLFKWLAFSFEVNSGLPLHAWITASVGWAVSLLVGWESYPFTTHNRSSGINASNGLSGSNCLRTVWRICRSEHPTPHKKDNLNLNLNTKSALTLAEVALIRSNTMGTSTVPFASAHTFSYLWKGSLVIRRSDFGSENTGAVCLPH